MNKSRAANRATIIYCFNLYLTVSRRTTFASKSTAKIAIIAPSLVRIRLSSDKECQKFPVRKYDTTIKYQHNYYGESVDRAASNHTISYIESKISVLPQKAFSCIETAF